MSDDRSPDAPPAPAERAPTAAARVELGPIRGATAIASPLPFGLGHDKPHAYRAATAALWENRDALPYVWQILKQGVCDGCALGPRGLRDDVEDGLHLCARRLEGLRAHTVPALAPADLLDIALLRQKTDAELQALGRLPFPFFYRRGDRGFTRITWEEAYRRCAELAPAAAPDRLAFLAGADRLSNEGAYVFAKAARLLGTQNIDLCGARASVGVEAALTRALGVGASTASLSDLVGADLILLVGPGLVGTGFGALHPLLPTHLGAAKALGGRVVSVSPQREEDRDWSPTALTTALFGQRLLDDPVQVSPGGVAPFFRGLLRALVERGAEDRNYVDRHTAGWEAARASALSTPWTELERQSGASRRDIEWVAELITRARSVVTVLLPAERAVEAAAAEITAAVVDAHLCRGMFGRPNTGILHLPAQFAAVGARDCGVLPDGLPGRRPLTVEATAALAERWGVPALPNRPGLRAVEMLEAALAGEIDLLYLLDADLSELGADAEPLSAAARRVQLRVHQDSRLHRSMLLEPGEGLLLLPAEARYEQRGGATSTSVERRVRLSPELPGHPTVGDSRPDFQIPGELARALRPGLSAHFEHADGRAVRAEMERCLPLYRGIGALEAAGDSVQWGGPRLCTEGQFPGLPDQRARFSAAPLGPPAAGG